jgi:hypothetical protein
VGTDLPILAAPNYAAVIESYEKAKDVGKQSR